MCAARNRLFDWKIISQLDKQSDGSAVQDHHTHNHLAVKTDTKQNKNKRIV